MPEINPPLYLPVDSAYGADELALPWRDIMGEGVVGTGDLLVAQRAAGVNKSVDVAAGAAWVTGDDQPAAQGAYRARSDSVVNLAIGANASGQPRIDRVIARVRDATFAGVQNLWALEVLAGTPTAGATLANLTGAAAQPNNAITLAYVLAANGYASISNAEILDARPRAAVGGGGAASRAGTRVYSTAAQAIATASPTMLTFNSVDRDDDVLWLATAPTRLTAKKAAWHSVRAHVLWAGAAGGATRDAYLLVNGATKIAFARGTANGANSVACEPAAFWYFNVGDYVEVQVAQDSGGNLNVQADAGSNRYLFDLEMIR